MTFANALAGTTSLAGIATYAGSTRSSVFPASAMSLLQGQDPMSKYEGPSSRMQAALLTPHKPSFHRTSILSNNAGATVSETGLSVVKKSAADKDVMRALEKEMCSYTDLYLISNVLVAIPIVFLGVLLNEFNLSFESTVGFTVGLISAYLLVPIIPPIIAYNAERRRLYNDSNDQIIEKANERVANPVEFYGGRRDLSSWCLLIKEAGRRVAGRESKYEGATVEWFKKVLRTGLSVKYEGRNVNLVASIPSKMLAPFVKMAKQSSSGTLVLAEIAEHNAWADSEGFVRDIEIKWKDEELGFEETAEAIEWLAMRGNESAVHWIAKKAKEENEEQERSLEIVEDLLNSDIPDSVYRVLESYGFTLRRGGPYRSQIRVAIGTPLSDEEREQAMAEALAEENDQDLRRTA